MPVVMIVLGFGLVIAGVWFAVGGFGTAAAHGTAIKGVSISGPSWLILVALGVAVIMGGGWMYKNETDAAPDPADVAADEFVTPFFYGDDVALDVLYDGCVEGYMNSCDDLYKASPAGSEYETFGATCGGRAPEADETWCVDWEKLPHSD